MKPKLSFLVAHPTTPLHCCLCPTLTEPSTALQAARAEIEASTASAPLVLFTWKSSPACKKALALLELTGVTPKIVALDEPWSKGNPIRAELGRLTKKSSVPSIWIGGEYVGGCDDGPSDAAPGLVPLAFKGQLIPKLQEAGAMPK